MPKKVRPIPKGVPLRHGRPSGGLQAIPGLRPFGELSR